MIKLRIREVDEVYDIYGTSDSYISHVLTCPYCEFEMTYFTLSPDKCEDCGMSMPYMPAILNKEDVRKWWHRAANEINAVIISKRFA